MAHLAHMRRHFWQLESVCLCCFVVERYQKQPMLPLFLLKDRRFCWLRSDIGAVCWFSVGDVFSELSLYQSYEYTALQAGAATLPISIIVALISRSMGRAVVKYGRG